MKSNSPLRSCDRQCAGDLFYLVTGREFGYVGELELKSGLRLQILPKIYFGGSEDRTKQIYLEMLKSTYRLTEKAMNQISLGMGDMELFEAYIRMYLDEAQMLVKRGLRSADAFAESSRWRGISGGISHIKRDSM